MSLSTFAFKNGNSIHSSHLYSFHKLPLPRQPSRHKNPLESVLAIDSKKRQHLCSVYAQDPSSSRSLSIVHSNKVSSRTRHAALPATAANSTQQRNHPQCCPSAASLPTGSNISYKSHAPSSCPNSTKPLQSIPAAAAISVAIQKAYVVSNRRRSINSANEAAAPQRQRIKIHVENG